MHLPFAELMESVTLPGKEMDDVADVSTTVRCMKSKSKVDIHYLQKNIVERRSHLSALKQIYSLV